MSKPNVIVIVSDQHRGDWMGCAGSRIVETPHMDRMAAQGVSFTRAYCNSPLCVPSRMSMLTGLYPHVNDVYANDDTLRSDLPTWAHAFGLGGYETVLCGRMHFVGPDQRHGFERRLVGDITHCYPGGLRTDYGALQGASGQGMRSIRTAGPGHSPVLEYDEQVVRASERLLAELAAGHTGRHAEHLVNQQTNRQTDQQAHQQTDGKPASTRPLLLCVGLYGPHHPYVCPPAYYERAREAMAADALLPPDEEPLHPWYAAWRERLSADEIGEEQLLTARACYAGLISLTDTYVGRIVQAARRLPGETRVIYMSDHGDMAGDRGMFWKRNMLEGAIRVPLLMCTLNGSRTSDHMPDITQGRRIDAPVSLIDLASTFARWAEASALPQQAGRDLTPLLQDDRAQFQPSWQERPVYAELANDKDGIIRTVIRGEMKLVYFAGWDDHLLFDLRQDPNELRNVWADAAYGEARSSLTALILDGDWDPQHIRARLDAKEPALKYLTRWGKEVGMGSLDLWHQPTSDRQRYGRIAADDELHKP